MAQDNSDQAKMERLLRLLVLLSGKRTYKRKDLAQLLELDTRTISRYIKTFGSAGFVVERTKTGYRLYSDKPQNMALLQSLYFSEEELYLLHNAIQSLASAHKIALKLKQKLHILYNYEALSQTANKRDADKIRVISEAVDHKVCVHLNRYHSINSKTIKDRLVEPFAFHDDFTDVWCWERQSGRNKLFRISRMEGVTVSHERWKFEEQHQIFFTDAFRMAAPKPFAYVEALLSLKAYELMSEEYPLAGKYLTVENGVYRLHIPVADYLGIARFVLGLPGEVKVLRPESFIKFLEEKRKKVWEGDGG